LFKILSEQMGYITIFHSYIVNQQWFAVTGEVTNNLLGILNKLE